MFRACESPKGCSTNLVFFFSIPSPLVYGDRRRSGGGLTDGILDSKQGQVFGYSIALFSGLAKWPRKLSLLGILDTRKCVELYAMLWRQQGHSGDAVSPTIQLSKVSRLSIIARWWLREVTRSFL